MSAKVLMLAQRPEAWVNIASVWSALRARREFEPHVLALPYNVEDEATSSRMMERTRLTLHRNGIPFEEWRDGRHLEDDGYAAVVINHPYDREREAGLAFRRLSAAIPTTVYIPYGLSMGGGKKNLRLQFAQPTQIGASGVVVRSAWEKGMYALHCPAGDGHVHVLGHPRFDRLVHDLCGPPPPAMSKITGDRLTILWNSHFSFADTYSQSSNFSTFDLVGPELFEFAKVHRDQLCLLWRPHPELFPVILRNRLLLRAELDVLRCELRSVGIVLDEGPSHVPAFCASDAILTDVGSFFLEYLVTGKPILALLNPEGEPLNEESSALIRHYASASSPNEVIEFIERLASGDPTLPDPSSALAEHLPGLDGQAGARVADMIAGLVTGTYRGDPPLIQSPQTSRRIGDQGRRRKRWELTTVAGAASPATPTLDKLMRGLRELRERKARESQWRKRLRRASNSVRTAIGETAKRHEALLQLSRTLRTRSIKTGRERSR